MNKRMQVETNIKAVRNLENEGIECYSGIIASGSWTRKEFDGMIRSLNTFKLPMPNIQPLMPIPGTPLYDELSDKIDTPRTSYELWDMAHIVIKPENISKASFYYNILRAYRKNFTNT